MCYDMNLKHRNRQDKLAVFPYLTVWMSFMFGEHDRACRRYYYISNGSLSYSSPTGSNADIYNCLHKNRDEINWRARELCNLIRLTIDIT